MMADNTELNPGTGGDYIATDDIGGIKHQRVKVGQGSDGVYGDISDANPLRVADQYFSMINISQGNVTGYSSEQKFGLNPDLDSGNYEDIWDGGGLYTWLTSATKVEVVSTYAGDTATTGDGARTLVIYGLDANYAPINETINLSGLSPSVTANLFLRVFRMKVLTAGALGQNGGPLTCRPFGGGTTIAEVAINANQTNMALYTIPAGKTGFIFKVFTSATDNLTKGMSEFNLRVREFGSVFAIKYNIALATDGVTCFERNLAVPIQCGEKSDILIRAQSNINNTIAVGAFDLILKDN